MTQKQYCKRCGRTWYGEESTCPHCHCLTEDARNKFGHVGDGTRYDIPYRGSHCYITHTPTSLDISMVAKKSTGEVDELTLTGLGLISTTITMLLEDGVSGEEIAWRIFENSRHKGDLADRLCKILEENQ